VRRSARLLVTGASGERVPLSAAGQRSRLVEGPADGAARVGQAPHRRAGQRGAGATSPRSSPRCSGPLDAGLDLPTGYYLRYGGQFEHLEAASRRLLIVVPARAAAHHHAAARHLRAAGATPPASSSACRWPPPAGCWRCGCAACPFSIPAGVGFVALRHRGARRHGARLDGAAAQGRRASAREAITTACERRLRPVLMTALVAALWAWCPWRCRTGVGAEVQRPLATVIIGGVITSTSADAVRPTGAVRRVRSPPPAVRAARVRACPGPRPDLRRRGSGGRSLSGYSRGWESRTASTRRWPKSQPDRLMAFS
jgi:cobalt-zinc-cadmium resistance protein CzcA